jgi:hypothetical protein
MVEVMAMRRLETLWLKLLSTILPSKSSQSLIPSTLYSGKVETVTKGHCLKEVICI